MRASKVFLCGLAFAAAVSVKAQSLFTHSLSVSSAHSGLQALAISPELAAVSESDFRDVRLFNSKGEHVPYFLVTEQFRYASSSFREYKVSDKRSERGYTSFTIHNPEKKNLQNIILQVMNSDAVKLCDITGSDDGREWYPVSDGIWLFRLFDENSVSAYRSIAFPMVNYSLLRVRINDIATLPLNILKAGYFDGSVSAGKMNLVTAQQRYETDNAAKKSRLQCVFTLPQRVDRVMFKVKEPHLYKRSARILVPRKKTVKSREESFEELVSSFELSSDGLNSVDVPSFREKEFFIEIDNADNPPLQFDSVSLMQLQSYLVADFRESEDYSLMAGDKRLALPQYDIAWFRDRISQFLPTLKVGTLVKLPDPVQGIVQPPLPFWQQSWFLWSCIAVASFMLFLFSVRILKDIRKNT
jgi:hypothetical protein